MKGVLLSPVASSFQNTHPQFLGLFHSIHFAWVCPFDRGVQNDTPGMPIPSLLLDTLLINAPQSTFGSSGNHK